jgi:hypothetical protein
MLNKAPVRRQGSANRRILQQAMVNNNFLLLRRSCPLAEDK